MIHLPCLQELNPVRLVALVEPDAQRRTQAAERAPTTTPYADLGAALAEPDIDAVVLCLPTPLHAEAAIASFEAGKHVFLEKPLAATLEDGQRIVEAWERAGTTGMVGYAFRYHPRYREARAVIGAGELGPLVGGTSVFTSAPRELPAWKQAPATGGGVLLDLASHHADLIPYLFGSPIVEVAATTASRRYEADQAAVRFTLEGGQLLQSFFSLTAGQDHRFDVYGEAGSARIDPWHRPHVDVVLEAARWSPAARVRRVGGLARQAIHRPDYHEPFRAILAAFADAARRGERAPTPSPSDGLRSLAVVTAAARSAREGRPVAIEDVPPPDAS
jgi:predicted dehydrogenase